MDLTTLLDFAEQFNAPAIRAEPSRCLNARNRAAACTRCAEVCPSGAIGVEDLTMALDPDACVRCGACLWSCPTGVFSQHYPPEGRLLGTVAQQDEGEAVELFCPAAGERAGRAPDALPVAAPRCLAALSPVMLLEMVGDGRTVWVQDGACADCPLGKTLHPVIEAAISQAAAWLALYDRPGRVDFLRRHDFTPLESPQSAVEGDAPSLDRRAFLRGRVRPRTLVDEQAVAIEAANPIGDRLPYVLPAERVRLHRLAERWGDLPNRWADPEALGIAAIAIDEDACTLCGWCAGFCPTAALEWHDRGDRLTVTFHPMRCLDCDICLGVCPVDAVGEMAQLPSAVIPREVLLAEADRAECRRCNQPTAAHSGDLCVFCRQQPDTDAILKDLLR